MSLVESFLSTYILHLTIKIAATQRKLAEAGFKNEFIHELLICIQEMPEALERQIEFIPALPMVKILGDKDKLK
ncbi:hypothetical protein [Nostoc sp.]